MRPDFTRHLLRWNRKANQRVMPWKGEKDPYKIWLSEIILQQTRVNQGLSYYNKFVDEYPTVDALANAEDSRVFKLWEGLGYYSRCRNLLETARTVVSRHDGRFPNTYTELLQLKGVGAYTAAAIASFAFNENRAVVDGNVQRVLARYFGISTPVDAPAGKKLFHQLAQGLIDQRVPGEYNQAIMDFGATVCKPVAPLCPSCVQSADCEAYRHGMVTALPVKQKKPAIKTRWFYYFIICVGDSVYIRRREEKDIWRHLYEFVLLERPGEERDPAPAFLKLVLPGHSYSIQAVSKEHVQQLTHQRIRGKFYVIQLPATAEQLTGYQLVSIHDLKEHAFPGLINNYFADAGMPTIGLLPDSRLNTGF